MTKININPKIKNLLLKLDLAEKEIDVYFGALQLGPTTILKLSNQTGVSRTGIYPIIQNLIKKNLMAIEYDGWKKFFVAENPNKLNLILDQKKMELENLLPEIIALYKTQESQNTIKIKNGKSEIKKVYLELLDIKNPKDYFVISNQEKWRLFLGDSFADEFIAKRAKVGFDIKMVFVDSPEARLDFEMQRKFKQQIKLLGKNVNFDTNIVITDQTILIHSIKGSGNLMKIQNEGMIVTLKALFEIVWEGLA
jgi:HTH-type transcriptional regulator, sugar sensing transcriptional regulator